MATQRSSIVCSILSLALTAIAWALPARGADPDTQSAPAMKMPESIQTLGEQPGEQGRTPEAGTASGTLAPTENLVVPAVGGSADGSRARSVADWRNPTPPSPAN